MVFPQHICNTPINGTGNLVTSFHYSLKNACQRPFNQTPVVGLSVSYLKCNRLNSQLNDIL